MNFILASIGVFLVTILVLVVILLVAKNFLVASGKVKLTVNGENQLEVESGSTLLNTLAVNNVFLPSACGGKGSCGQCKCQVLEGGGEILPSEVSHFLIQQQGIQLAFIKFLLTGCLIIRSHRIHGQSILRFFLQDLLVKPVSLLFLPVLHIHIS